MAKENRDDFFLINYLSFEVESGNEIIAKKTKLLVLF